MWRQRGRPAAFRLRRVFVALASFVIAMSVLSSAARAGGTFFYCTMAQTFDGAPCCDHAAAVVDNAPAFRLPDVDCCERGQFPALPSADVPRAPEPPPPAIPVAIAWAPRLVDALANPLPLSRARVVDGAAPPPLYASQTCARLMVFLT